MSNDKFKIDKGIKLKSNSTASTEDGELRYDGSNIKFYSTTEKTLVDSSTVSGTNTGDVTLGAFGSAPDAKGASISSQVLTIQPADATHPGAITTGAQTIAGAKTFSSTIVGSVNGNAATVTTNANLTGPITSSGNATSVAAQTGTGSTFVMQDTPTLTTPVIGAATGTSLSVSGQLTSTIATGTAPLVVSSTTEVANLKAATATLAATVTTNADLTGPITSSGNATSVAAQTGTGSTFVMQASPTLTTPVIGAATGTSLSVSGQLTSTVATGTAPLVVSSTTSVANLLAGGNLSATANQYGVLLSGAANVATVLAPDASTTKVLTSGGASANPTWSTVTAAPTLTYQAKTTTYSANAGELVNCTSGTFTVTLPTAVSIAGQSIVVKNSGTGAITIATTSSQTIDGLATSVISLGMTKDFIQVTSDGANWTITAQRRRSRVVRNTGAGHGSTNTKIRRIETTVGSDIGTDITYASDATNGTSFTINTDGCYSITYSDRADVTASTVGVSLNSAQLTTNINSLTAANRIAYNTESAGGFASACSVTLPLAAGDVVRPHDNGANNDNTGTEVTFSISRIG